MAQRCRCSAIVNSISSFQPLFSNTFQGNPSYAITSEMPLDCSGLVAYLNFRSKAPSSRNGMRTRGVAWRGVGFSKSEMYEIADQCGFTVHETSGAGTQYFWLTFIKR